MHHDNLGVNDMCRYAAASLVPHTLFVTFLFSWATPNPTPTYTAVGARRSASPAKKSFSASSSTPHSTLSSRMRPAVKRSATPVKFVVTSPMPHTYVSNVPRSWDIRDVAGGSFSTVNLNQHNPQYCGRYLGQSPLPITLQQYPFPVLQPPSLAAP
jgi:hypothetical protein